MTRHTEHIDWERFIKFYQFFNNDLLCYEAKNRINKRYHFKHTI